MKLFLNIVFLFLASTVIAQSAKEKKNIDSLLTIIKSKTNDSIKVNAFFAWDNIIYINNQNLDDSLNKCVRRICENKLKQKLRGKEKIFYKTKLASSLNNLGIISRLKGNYPEALQIYLSSQKIYEELKDFQGLCNTHNNIGGVYLFQEGYDEALKHYKLAINYGNQVGDSVGNASTMINIGGIFQFKGDYKLALDYFLKAMKIIEKSSNNKEIANNLANIGNAYLHFQNYTDAKIYYLKAMRLFETLNDLPGLGSVYKSLGTMYYHLNDYKNAKDYIYKALNHSLNAGIKENIKECYFVLSSIDSATGNFKNAFLNFKKFFSYNDSLKNEENTKKITEQKLHYEFGKRSAADSVLNAKAGEIKDAEIARQESEINAKRSQQLFLFGGLILVLLFGIIMFNRFRVTQKQKKIIEAKEKETSLQKEIIEEKQKEIIDSIHYAKRIQQALLPNKKYVEKNIDRLKKKNS